MQLGTSLLWQQALKDAIEEADSQLALAKIANAEIAVFNRMNGFVPNGNLCEEQALFEALETIRALKGLPRY